jgi:adenylate cyclase
MAKLAIFANNDRREVNLVEKNPVGRHSKNRIRLRHRAVSSEHCLIFFDKNRGYVIKDLGSLNGTFVNKKRIKGEAMLHDGDEVVVGSVRCVFLSKGHPGAVVKMVESVEGALQSYIHSKVAPLAQDKFLPEKKITDDKALRIDYEKLRVTYELQRDIGFETDIDLLLERILERTSEFLTYDRGVILMADESGCLKPRAYRIRKGEDKLIISSTLIRHIQKEKTGILSSDALMDNRFKKAHSIIAQSVRSTMAVPILHQDDLLGIMIIDSSESVNAYTEKDLHLLTNIANQTAQFIKNSQMAKKIEKDAATRERFQRLLSPDLAEMVVSGRLKVEKGGESRVATVLFADIRGFTAMSENMEATEVLQMLNDYFEVMVEIVFRHEGTVDKFVGDEMMVIWGAPVPHDDDPCRAIRAALDMQAELVELNKILMAEEQRQIHVGIGINTGDLVAGYIGSTRTMSYSVIGDTVNTASRLCSAANAGQIIISENTYNQARDVVEAAELEPIRAKGKCKPIRVFNVLGEKSLASLT